MTTELVRFSLNTRKDMASWSFGKRFVQSLCDFDPRFVPERVGHGERRTAPFAGIDDCESLWASPIEYRMGDLRWDSFEQFWWRRSSRVRALGRVDHTRRVGPRNELFPGTIKSDFGAVKDVRWREFFAGCCQLCEPIFAMLHWFTAHEMKRGEMASGSPQLGFRLGTQNWELAERQIPQLAWGTYWGEELAQWADVAALRQGGFDVEPLGNGWLLWLSPNLTDVLSDFSSFVSRRSEAKRHFLPGLFMLPD